MPPPVAGRRLVRYLLNLVALLRPRFALAGLPGLAVRCVLPSPSPLPAKGPPPTAGPPGQNPLANQSFRGPPPPPRGPPQLRPQGPPSPTPQQLHTGQPHMPGGLSPSMQAMSQPGSPAGGQPGSASRIDPNQIPRPQSTTSPLEFDTRVNGSANLPPSATTNFVVRDTGNCSPRSIRCTLNQIPCSGDLLSNSVMPLAVITAAATPAVTRLPLALPDPTEEAIQQQSDPVFVRSAALASLTDIIVRLGGLLDFAATVRRDGASLISKLIQPLLHLIGDKDSSVLLDEAMDLLIAVLKYFPNCLRQHSISVEVSLVARFVDANCRASVRQKCAKALAFLPKAHGDAASWSSLMRRILIAVNADLDFTFRGMEEVSVAEGATRALLPLGQDPPRLLGGQSNTSIQPGKHLWQQLLPRIFSLLQCCNYLLTSPYPTPVPAPVGPLLTLVMRILNVDGSRSSSLFSSQQVSLRSELPALHFSALELLAATLRGVRGQLLPRGAALANLLTDHFPRTERRYPSLRVKLYAVSRDLFIAMGAGMVSALAPAVVGSAFLDLKGSSSRENLPSNPVKATRGGSGSQGINSRKRKEAGGLPGNHSGNGLAEVASTEGEGRVPLAVQVAALQALEALLNTGGALLPERWRAEVDAVLAGVATRVAADTTSFNLSCDDESSYSRSTGTTPISVDVQVAAYQALLASLLAPCGHRPPYLAQGLALFRNGRKEVGTEVATVCVRALMALEPLIHPRCLPPANAFPDTGMNAQPGSTTGLVRGKDNGFFGGSSVRMGHLSVDPWAMVDTWLGYGEDAGDDDAVISNISLLRDAANVDRVTFANGAANGSLGEVPADRGTRDRRFPTTPMVEDPMQVETKTIVPENSTPLVRDSVGVESRGVDDSPSKQGHGVQPPVAASIEEEPLSQGYPNSKADVAIVDLVTVSTEMVTSTSVIAVEPVGARQGNQESTVDMETVVTESVSVTTTSVSVVAEQTASGPKVIELGSESDSDGPLPGIVDGDPDSESD